MKKAWTFSIMINKNTLLNEIEITQMYQIMAETGNIDAQFVYGKRLQNGEGLPKNRKYNNLEESFKWLKRSADKGHIQAQNAMGYAFAHGLGVIENSRQSFMYYKCAADNGNDSAMYNIALCYREGYGTHRNNIEFEKWIKYSCDAGYLPAIKTYNKF